MDKRLDRWRLFPPPCWVHIFEKHGGALDQRLQSRNPSLKLGGCGNLSFDPGDVPVNLPKLPGQG